MDHKRLRQARWTVRSRLSERSVYLAVARRKYGHMVVSEKSELLIDGFTRCGVVFATIAFQLAQPRPVRLTCSSPRRTWWPAPGSAFHVSSRCGIRATPCCRR